MPELAVAIGSVWFERSGPRWAGATTGPAHVVVRNDGGALVLLNTHGGQVAITADRVGARFAPETDPEIIEMSLKTAEGWAEELERQAHGVRVAVAAFREAQHG